MNLFWKKLFGSLQSTAKTEAKYVELTQAYQRYLSVSDSKELKEYEELYARVKSPEFKELKKTLQSRKYKDTQEYRDWKKYQKLEKDSHLASYFRILESAELKEFLAFEKTPDFKLLGDPKAVKESEELTRMKKYEKGKDYKVYMRFHDSYLLKEYEELKAKVATPEFIESNAFWSDNKRWDKTEESQLETRYFELCKNEDIQFYLKINAKEFETISKMTLTFEEQFEWNTLNNSRWDNGFHQGDEALMSDYSFVNQKQAHNGGENISVVNGILNVNIRKESKKSRAWDETQGFVEKDFDYTSDIIHGHNAICQKGGIFSAKVRFTGSKDVSPCVSLKGDNQAPHILLCHYNGKKIEVGVHWKSKFEDKYSGTSISGINPSDYYIYSLVWNDQELVWYINNMEVFRTSEGLPTEAVYPMINSFIAEHQKGGEGKMEIDWIEVFSYK